MKKLMRKAITVLGSAALIGMTVGSAAAAAYPAPFTSNTAIVVGANAAPSDNIAASNIASDLDASAVGGAETVTGGDSFKLEKSSVNYNLGDTMTSLATSLDEDEMPTALAKGIYKDINRTEYDYEQDISLTGAQLTLFTDTKYNDKEPTLGFNILKNAGVLNYTITFKDGGILATAIDGTDLPLMGNDYYVLSVDNTNNEMELLDSAASAIIAEGEESSVSVDGVSYTVNVNYVSATDVKLTVNGETTDKLQDGESYKLSDGSYVAVKEILYASKETGVSKVEFTIGAGKLKLVNGDDIEMNDETIDGVAAFFNVSTATTLSTIVVEWTAGEEMFLTEDDSVVTMPGFKVISAEFGGLEFPTAETTELIAGDQLILETPVKDGDLSLEVINYSSNITLGGADYNLVYANSTNDMNLTQIGDYFVASSSADSGAEYATYAYELSKVQNSSSTTDITLASLTGGSDITFDEIGATEEEGDVLFTLVSFDDTADSAIIDVTNVVGSGATVSTTKVYSDAGLTINLPAAIAGNTTDTVMVFQEADKDGKVENGENITANVSINTAETAMEVVNVARTTGAEVSTTADNDYLGYLYSELATSYVYNTDGDLHEFTVSYYGDEVIADVRIVAGGSVSSSSEAGVMTVSDANVASVAGKNLIVVGGSAINSVAAELLGGALSEGAFTAATGVAAGEFLIQSYDRSGKSALLVAGYNAADTEKAVTYLLNNDVNTDAGMKYKGTSAEAATLVIA